MERDMFTYQDPKKQKPPPPETRCQTIPAFRVTPSYRKQFDKAQLDASVDAGFCYETSEYLRRAVYFAMRYMRHEEVLKKMYFSSEGNITIKMPK